MDPLVQCRAEHQALTASVIKQLGKTQRRLRATDRKVEDMAKRVLSAKEARAWLLALAALATSVSPLMSRCEPAKASAEPASRGSHQAPLVVDGVGLTCSAGREDPAVDQAQYEQLSTGGSLAHDGGQGVDFSR